MKVTCYLWQDNISPLVLCPECPFGVFYCKILSGVGKKQAHPPWSWTCPDMICGSVFCCQCHFHCLPGAPSTKHSGEEGSSVPVRKMSKEVGTNCAGNAIISGLHIERHQGHQHHCCMFCELPFNAFPRAALEMCYRGSEIENNILNGPSAPVLFLASGERGRGERRESETGVTFKFHTGDMLPSGLWDRCSLGAISCNSSVV